MNKLFHLILLLLILYSVILIFHYEKIELSYDYEKVKNKKIEREEDCIIPKNIIQSFSSRYVTKEMKKNIDNWINLNEEYSYTYFDEYEIVEFIKKYYSDEHLLTFYRINAGAGRADFFRYLYLYKFGGFWIDITLKCFVPLRNYIKNTTELAVVYDVDPDNIYNAFMGFPKNHQILKNCIEKCIKHVKGETFKNKKNYCIYHTTGPELLKIEYDNYFKNKEKKEIVVLTKELILKNNITQIIRELDTYNCFYILLNGKKVMKTKFKNAKENLEFISKKKHYKKISFFNDNIDFISGIIEIKKLENKIKINKDSTLLIKSSHNYKKLLEFYKNIEKEKILDVFNIILIDDFSQNKNLIEIYKKLINLGVLVKINSIKYEENLFLESLNYISENSKKNIYLDNESLISTDFLNNNDKNKSFLFNYEDKKDLEVKFLKKIINKT